MAIKEAEALCKQQEQEQKEKDLQERRLQRENTCKEKATEVAHQKAVREAAKAQKQVDKQLADEAKKAQKPVRKQQKQNKATEATNVEDLTVVMSQVVVSAQTRSGRRTRQPGHLKDFFKE